MFLEFVNNSLLFIINQFFCLIYCYCYLIVGFKFITNLVFWGLSFYVKFFCISIVFLPLGSGIIVGLFGRFLSGKFIEVLSIGSMLLTVFFSIFILSIIVESNNFIVISFGDWVVFNASHKLKWCFLFDSLSVSMLCVVSSVSFVVHLYSLFYMGSDPHKVRFMAYLSLFTFFMFFLVTADNLLQLFLGWEGVGLCSYLLIGFWYHRIEANKSALKAIFINKIGDIFLFFGIILCYYVFNSVKFSVIFGTLPFFTTEYFLIYDYPVHCLSLITSCFFIAACGKSAQLGLHTWLPDAMEGPTPVSALIHAATMVTAGIFLIIRCSWIFTFTPIVNFVMIVWGLLTINFAGLVASVQYDIKKVIAYSTCSQLGFMLLSCGLLSYSEALGHLVGHAFFKAALFLGAGFIIYNLHDEQDMRKMGSLGRVSSVCGYFVYFAMVVASLGLIGFIGFTGFYTKDPIVFSLIKFYWVSARSVVFYYEVFLLFGLFLTSYYSIRLLCLVFWGEMSRSSTSLIKHYGLFTKENIYLVSCVSLLTIFSVLFGLEWYQLFFGVFNTFFFDSIFLEYSSIDAELIFLMLFYFYYIGQVFLIGNLESFYIIFTILGVGQVNNLNIFSLPVFSSVLGCIVGYVVNNTRFGWSLYNCFYNPVYYFLYKYIYIIEQGNINNCNLVKFNYIQYSFLKLVNFVVISWISIKYVYWLFFNIDGYKLGSNIVYGYKLLWIFVRVCIFSMVVGIVGSLFVLHFFVLFVVQFCLLSYKYAVYPLYNTYLISMYLQQHIDRVKEFFSFPLFDSSYNKVVYLIKTIIYRFLYFLHTLFGNKFFFDKVNNRLANSVFTFGFVISFKSLDKGLYEFVGPTGIIALFYKLGRVGIRFHNGSLFRYFKAFLYSLFIIFFIFIIF